MKSNHSLGKLILVTDAAVRCTRMSL